MLKYLNYSTISLSLLSATILIVYIVLGWACFHGIDITDESFYVVGYQQSARSAVFLSFYFEVYKALFGWLELNLAGMRLIRLLFTALSSLFLAFSFIKVRSSPTGAILNSERWFILLLVLVGGAVTYSWGPTAISYNSFTMIFLNILVGITLLKTNKTGIMGQLILDVLFGVFIMLLLFVKFSSAFLFMASYLVYLGCNKKLWPVTRHHNRTVLTILLGCVLVIFIVFNTYVDFADQIARLYELMENKSGVSWSSSTLLGAYLKNLGNLLNAIWMPCLLISLMYVISFIWREAAKISFAVSLAVIPIYIYLMEWWIGGTPNKYQNFEFYAVVLVFCVCWSNFFLVKRKNIILTFFLFSMPFVGALGSTNGLSAQFMFFMPFFMLLIANSVVEFRLKSTKIVLLVIIVLLGSSQAIVGTTLYPYRDKETLFDKKNKIENGGGFSGQYIGGNMISLYENLKEFEDVDLQYLFTYRHQTGLSLLLNKNFFSPDWFNENFYYRICSIIEKRTELHGKQILFILQKEVPYQNEVNTCLNKVGIKFPSDYEVVKEVEYFHYSLHENITLQVYLPKTYIEEHNWKKAVLENDFMEK
ncbi:MAG: hypothetical protein HOK72_07335 [Flavobacteriales bacterium]|nr:hypothetical protein [Flavobacteriales bacterium]